MVLPAHHQHRIYVALNAAGRRIGETHHNARIPDTVVDILRERHEDQGIRPYLIAQEFALPSSTVKMILTYQRRAQTPAAFRRLEAGRKDDQRPSLDRVRRWRRMKQMQKDLKALTSNKDLQHA